MDYTFDSKFKNIGTFKADWSEEIVKNEPMLFNCDLNSAYKLGGPITREFLNRIPWLHDDVVVDSRVHMLMKGWYPAIPGFHHDDVPRSTLNGQPNYDNPEYNSEHLMGLVNGEICPTVFAVGKMTLPKLYSKDSVIYEEWNKVVDNLVWKRLVREEEAESGKVIYFDCNAMHRVQEAKENGWRWFIRVSRNTHRTRHVTNEVRRQVQVYMSNPTQGW